jgi:adenine-specific DNA-methyltransferase
VKPTSSWTHKWANSERGTEQFIELGFDKRTFKNPKPIGLIQAMLKMATTKDDIILDFFTGSGSSAQATLELNEEEPEKQRKFICVQIGEKIKEDHFAYSAGYRKISEITLDRIKRTLEKLDGSQGFKIYKQDRSSIYKWHEFNPSQDGGIVDLFSKLELDYKNPLQDGTKQEDFVTEIILQKGFPLTSVQEEVSTGIFKITHQWVPYTLYVTMNGELSESDINTLELSTTDHFVCLDKAFSGNDAIKQSLDNKCNLFTI